MQRFLDPKNDWAFKRVFGTEQNKDVLVSFLNTIFEGVQDPIENVEFLPLHQDPAIAALRQSVVDVKCTDTKNRQFIVEMQCYNDPYFIKRACVYASRAYADQKSVGTPYSAIKPVIFLAILDNFNLIEGTQKYLSHNQILDTETHECHIKEFSFSFLELKKFDKNFEESQTVLEKWCYFLKNAPKTDPEELEEIQEHYPLVSKAYTALDQFNYTEEEYEAYWRYEMGAEAHADSITGARREGKLEGKREVALSLLANNIPLETICQCTGLSPEEIKVLQASDK
jgi:predicted transposase/invertase (TIGR01784 family)